MRERERERQRAMSLGIVVSRHTASHIVTSVIYDIEEATEKFVRGAEENDDIAYGSVGRRVNA